MSLLQNILSNTFVLHLSQILSATMTEFSNNEIQKEKKQREHRENKKKKDGTATEKEEEKTQEPPLSLRSSSNPNNSPLVAFRAVRKGSKCPFGNESVGFELHPGGCVWLRGNSGVGKTTLSSYLAGISTPHDLDRLDIRCEVCDWDPAIPQSERCGVLFQQTTLIDELTIAGNISLALVSCPSNEQQLFNTSDQNSRDHKIQQLMEMVGLDYRRDCNKRPTQLSGGMARRASLAMQLAQRKRVIVLDEPFTGLDYDAATSVAWELVKLRKTRGTSFLLITHEPLLAKLVLYGQQEDEDEKPRCGQKEKQEKDTKCEEDEELEKPVAEEGKTGTNRKHNYVFELTPPSQREEGYKNNQKQHEQARRLKLNLFGITIWNRFTAKLIDYIGWSLPLIVLTFIACGLAISMLSLDILQRIDVTDNVLDIVDEYVRPLIGLVTGSEDPNPMVLMIVKMKIKSMINTALPEAKSKLYAIGMAKLFVLEIGPLLTALLLCGRIGGSYAGKVATMEATSQNRLLQTLGVHPRYYTLLPAMLAALIASPILTLIGTIIAIVCGGVVGPNYYGGITTLEMYTKDVYDAVFPELRIRNIHTILYSNHEASSSSSHRSLSTLSVIFDTISKLSYGQLVDFRTTHHDDRADYFLSIRDTVVEITTYPPVFLLLKSATYITIVLLVAECSARLRRNLSPRGVPTVITSSVVVASLLVIVADWGFSQWLILRH